MILTPLLLQDPLIVIYMHFFWQDMDLFFSWMLNQCKGSRKI